MGGGVRGREVAGAVRARRSAAAATRIAGRNRGGAELAALGLGAHDQRSDQAAIFHHMRKGFAGLDMTAEGQEHRTGGVLQPGVGDDHVEDRL